jgi:(p)ppGpp synthase/HD superfamily hydrolase
MSIKKMTREDFIQSPADDTRVVGVLKKDWDKTTITENGQEKEKEILTETKNDYVIVIENEDMSDIKKNYSEYIFRTQEPDGLDYVTDNIALLEKMENAKSKHLKASKNKLKP